MSATDANILSVQIKISNKDECIGSKHPQDERYMFSSKLAIKMSATVGNTLRMNAMCSVQTEQLKLVSRYQRRTG